MRYAIVSDLHANLQAWNAVYLDLRSNGAERIICLGDVVGYGPSPADVLQAVHQQVDHVVLGNHDAALCGKLDEDLFNDTARELLVWTRGRLSGNAQAFIRTWPLTLAGDGFRCAHGAFDRPALFPYLLSPQDAAASWQQVDEPLLFVGHTHEPALYVRGASGVPHRIEPQDFELESGKRYLVNVGSVGSPRDGDARASYCLYDTTQQAVYWRRVPFDLDAFRTAVRQCGIPDTPCYFLHHDPRQARRPLRELLSFKPPASADEGARDVIEVQTLVQLRRSLRAWQYRFAALVTAAALAAAVGGRALWRHQTQSLVLAEPALTPLDAATIPEDGNLLALPAAATDSGAPIPGWVLSLGNRYRQSARVVVDADGTSGLELTSKTSTESIDLATPPIKVAPGTTFHPDALFRKSPDFAGSVALVVSVTRTAGGRTESLDQFYVKEPNQPRADGWSRAREKLTLPAGSTAMRFRVRGRFTGTVTVKAMKLTRR